MKINNPNKSEDAYKTIGEVAKELCLIDKIQGYIALSIVLDRKIKFVRY